MRRLFGTDGIRGIANKTLTADLAYKVGLATAKLITSNHFRDVKNSPFGDDRPVVLIGTDTRPSKDMIVSAITSGLTAGGVNIVPVGILPTPAIAYLTKLYSFAALGIMITASHNPKEYNGIKIIGPDGYKLPDQLEEQIEDLISKIEPDTVESYYAETCGKIISNYTTLAANDYFASLMQFKYKPIRIAVDCSNGSASTCYQIFKSLGLSVREYNTDESGEHINEGCGSMHLEFLQDLIKNSGLAFDCGIAFDGDADRCLLVDETGEIVDGDHVLAIVGGFLKDLGLLKNNLIVGTVMSNLGLVKFCESKGIKFLSTKVGDKYVLEEMITNNGSLGGEQSGHIIFKEYATTGDGILTALMVLNIMDKTGKKLSELKNQMFKYPQVSTQITATPEQKNAFIANNSLRQRINDLVYETLGNDGRSVVRPSGTENYIRIMVEGKDYDTIAKLRDDIQALIVESLN